MPNTQAVAIPSEPTEYEAINRLLPSTSKAIDSLIEDDPIIKQGGFKPLTKEMKKAFIEQYVRCNFVFKHACEKFGIGETTMRYHVYKDNILKAMLDLAARSVIDKLQGVAIEQGMKPQGTTDRWNLLKAHKPEVYGRPEQVVATQVNFDLTGLSTEKGKDKPSSDG